MQDGYVVLNVTGEAGQLVMLGRSSSNTVTVKPQGVPKLEETLGPSFATIFTVVVPTGKKPPPLLVSRVAVDGVGPTGVVVRL